VVEDRVVPRPDTAEARFSVEESTLKALERVVDRLRKRDLAAGWPSSTGRRRRQRDAT
jgi:hypothetical protein